MIAFVTATDAESASDRRYQRLLDLPPSAKLVYRVLQEEAPLTQGQIRDRALLPARTTRDALRRLEAVDLVVERPHVPDARKRQYTPRPVDPPGD